MAGQKTDTKNQPGTAGDADAEVNARLKELQDSIDDLRRQMQSQFTRNNAAVPRAAPAVAVTAPGFGIDRQIDQAFKALLGFVPRAGDTQSVLEAFGRLFSSETVDGKTVWTLRPPSYAAPRTTGSEALTGVQAKLYKGAALRLSNATSPLQNLRTILPGGNADAVEAIRGLLLTKWSSFVEELGDPDGPNFVRTDELADEIAWNRVASDGTPLAFSYLTRLGGYLGVYELDATGRPKLVNGHPLVTKLNRINSDDETVVTTFLLIKGDVQTTIKEYHLYRSLIKDDLGTKTAALRRLLDTAADTLEELRSALDAVMVDTVERQTVTIPYTHPESGRTYEPSLEALLSWVDEFVSREAIESVEKGGRIGIASLRPTAALLSGLIDEVDVSAKPSVAGLTDPTVTASLDELRGNLDQIVELAKTEDNGVPQPAPAPAGAGI